MFYSVIPQIVYINVSRFITFCYHYFKARHYSTGWVCSVCTDGDENYVSVRFITVCMVGTYSQQSSILSLCTTVRLQRGSGKPSDIAKPGFEFRYNLLVTLPLIFRSKWMDTIKCRPAHW